MKLSSPNTLVTTTTHLSYAIWGFPGRARRPPDVRPRASCRRRGIWTTSIVPASAGGCQSLTDVNAAAATSAVPDVAFELVPRRAPYGVLPERRTPFQNYADIKFSKG